jgi:hypothetical protein
MIHDLTKGDSELEADRRAGAAGARRHCQFEKASLVAKLKAARDHGVSGGPYEAMSVRSMLQC